jgi:UDPglucose--hexose-1-phosphate uridylyltransferase
MKFNINNHPHRRFNPLTGDWILLSPNRTDRPWKGKLEKTKKKLRPAYDGDCYLCPGNTRANGKINDKYKGPYVFDNDFPALLPDTPVTLLNNHPLLRVKAQSGLCKVICYSERHDMTLAEMPKNDVRKVIDILANQSSRLAKKYHWVQIFENKGSIMGCSNPHPHCQIWASRSLPNEPFKEDVNQAKYFHENNNILLVDYIKLEEKEKIRIVAENDQWIVVVPFWALWPFETLLLPKSHTLRIHDLSDKQRNTLAEILKTILSAYDSLFETPFPYSMGWHGAPNGDNVYMHWHLHAHFYPPLLKSANIKKFMVGYEMLAEAQRDLTPESAVIKLTEKMNALN